MPSSPGATPKRIRGGPTPRGTLRSLKANVPDGPVMATRIANHCIAIYYPSLPPLPED